MWASHWSLWESLAPQCFPCLFLSHMLWCIGVPTCQLNSKCLFWETLSHHGDITAWFKKSPVTWGVQKQKRGSETGIRYYNKFFPWNSLLRNVASQIIPRVAEAIGNWLLLKKNLSNWNHAMTHKFNIYLKLKLEKEMTTIYQINFWNPQAWTLFLNDSDLRNEIEREFVEEDLMNVQKILHILITYDHF